MIFVFLIIIICLMVAHYHIHKRNINPFSITALPYVIIIPLNNFVLHNVGYYAISESTILMITLGLVLFSVGTLISSRKLVVENKKKVLTQERDDDYNSYDYKSMLYFAAVAEGLVLIRCIIIVASRGFRFFASDQNEGYLLSGILGHVMLAYYPLIPILFYYWLKNKKDILFLVISIAGVGLFFLTFVKYHSISLIILTYLYVTVKDRRYIRKGTLLLISIVTIFFVGNYMLTFMERGVYSRVSSSFYSNHLWNYVGGSVIRDNYIFEYGYRKNWSGLYKVGRMVFALPNMVFNKILGFELFSGLESDSGKMLIGNGEGGTTFDFIGYMYPTDKSFEGYFFFVITLISIGFISIKLYNGAVKKGGSSNYLLSALAFMTFFNFFWFFGVYGSQRPPWEIILWSSTIPLLFKNVRKKHIHYRFRNKGRRRF